MSDVDTSCDGGTPQAEFSREVEPYIAKIKMLENKLAEMHAMVRNYKDEVERLTSKQSSQPVVNIIIGGQHTD